MWPDLQSSDLFLNGHTRVIPGALANAGKCGEESGFARVRIAQKSKCINALAGGDGHGLIRKPAGKCKG